MGAAKMEASKKRNLLLYTSISLLLVFFINNNIHADGGTLAIANPPTGMKIAGPVEIKKDDGSTKTKYKVAPKPTATPATEKLVFTGSPKINCKLHNLTEHMPPELVTFLETKTQEIPVA